MPRNDTFRTLTFGLLGATAALGAVTIILFLTNTAGVGLFLTLTIIAALLTVAFAVLGLFATRTAPATTPSRAVSTTTPATTMSTTVTTPKTSAYYDFKGDVHPVIDIEGIGETYAKRLNAIGIETTARLCFEDAEKIAKAIDAPVKTVQKWQAMAELAKVNGIGKQYAEALVRGGVMGIDGLKNAKADAIATEVSQYMAGLENNVLGQKVTPTRVASWQKKAATMRRVRQPVPDA